MRALAAAPPPEIVFEIVRRRGGPSVFFDGRGAFDGRWPCRLAVDPRVVATAPAGRASIAALESLDARIASRRSRGGPGGTGLMLALAYEALHAPAAGAGPGLVALEVDASLTFPGDGPALAVGDTRELERALDTAAPHALEKADGTGAVAAGELRTSLPRDRYLEAVAQVRRHIAAGDVYQANLTQMFEARFEGDPWGLYRRLSAGNPAPRSAFVEVPGLALVSVSPELFVDVDKRGRAETRPIKGTRPRGATPSEDAANAADLLASAKDRAELTMIVDLERNDLGRIARAGTVRAPELHALRSYPAVHHLVACVEAELSPETRPSDLVRAVFPGGSITGAPKRRAIEILATLEPVPRGLYTGSLFWLDDDGGTWSSILIRSAVVAAGRVEIGAGGGVVAESDPEAEWMEANAKARALTRAIGFEPEEAR